MNRSALILTIASALAVSAAGCGDDDNGTPAKAPAAAATATPDTPYGTYVRTLTEADLERTDETRRETTQERGAGLHLPPTGDYRLVIAKGASGDVIKAIDPEDFPVDMHLRAQDGVLYLEAYVDPARGAFCGPEVEQAATYRYALDGTTLEIEPSSSDPCADRDAILSGTWEKG